MTKDEPLARALATDYESATIDEPDKAMLRYVDKLTRMPNRIERCDVEYLRRAGFTDAAILDICQVAAYYAFVNRLADGLGVELEGNVEE